MLGDTIFAPYPLRNTSWKLILVISLFVSLFMIIFQPFGTNSLPASSRTLILFGYGIVTLLALSLNLKLISRIFNGFINESNWTVLSEILWVMWIIFTIGSLNFIYTDLILSNIGSFLSFQLYTLSIAFFPVLILTLISNKLLISKYRNQALELAEIQPSQLKDPDRSILDLSSENNKDLLSLPLDQLVYIESQGNYILIHALKGDSIETLKMRNTLSGIESQLREKGIIQIQKCHRAFMVNLEHVHSFSGNAQGLKLVVHHGRNVPVSRTFVPSIKASLLETS